VALDPDAEVLATIGAKEGFSHLMWVLLQPGDAALVPSPSYPIHIWGPLFAGAEVREIPVGTGEDFFEGVQAAYRWSWPRPRVIVLSFPHNPPPPAWTCRSCSGWWTSRWSTTSC
jgi:alanine-synthesizing transaminase